MKSIVFKITFAVSLLVLIAIVSLTYISGREMTDRFNQYMTEAAQTNDPYPMLKNGNLVTGPAEKSFLRDVYTELVMIGFPIIILVFVISYLIARGSTRSIRKLSRAVKEISKGNLSHKVDINEGGEIGLLANSFNSMADELTQAQALRKQFFADAAHELKTPIAVIKGNLEGMIDDVIPTDKRALNSLLEETDFLSNMVGDIKYLALADSGQLELKKKRTDVKELVLACVKRLETAASTRNLTLTTEFPPEDVIAFIDPDRITQIVYNLLINAGKYTPPDGSIIASVEKLIENGTECFKVTIRDTGLGISDEDVAHIFERFYRADKSRDRKTGGIGLGLSIVKKFTELHGGRVGVKSGLNKGSTFYIVVPIS